jgi:hypothetical protein
MWTVICCCCCCCCCCGWLELFCLITARCCSIVYLSNLSREVGNTVYKVLCCSSRFRKGSGHRNPAAFGQGRLPFLTTQLCGPGHVFFHLFQIYKSCTVQIFRFLNVHVFLDMTPCLSVNSYWPSRADCRLYREGSPGRVTRVTWSYLFHPFFLFLYRSVLSLVGA